MWRIEFNPGDLIMLDGLLRAEFPQLFKENRIYQSHEVSAGMVHVSSPTGAVSLYAYEFEMGRHPRLVFWDNGRRAVTIKSKRN